MDEIDVDITDIVRSYLVQFASWLNTDRELQDSLDPAKMADAFLKEVL